jgi:tagatose-1,6-bisphosphate aldolase non-catalytic subunit AgaZ/GatZ
MSNEKRAKPLRRSSLVMEKVRATASWLLVGCCIRSHRKTFATEELRTLIARIIATIDSGADPDNAELHHMTDEAVYKCATDILRMAQLIWRVSD